MTLKRATSVGSAVAANIQQIHGIRVIFDVDLARLYGVTTARLNQQFRRNRERFPAGFAMELKPADLGNLMLQNATSRSTWGGHRNAGREDRQAV